MRMIEEATMTAGHMTHARCLFFPAAKHDMMRDAEARSLIFDLDIVIQAWWSGLGKMTLKRSN
jgi:hypothetical protein